MVASKLREAISTEIEDLHEFFQGWFSGVGPSGLDVLDSGLRQRLAPDFTLILPGGTVFEGDGFLAGMVDAHGSNRDFRIQIRDVRLRAELAPNCFLVTYEEWQKNAANSKPSNNGRLSTAILMEASTLGLPFQWVHVHETWLPADRIAAEPFSF